MYSIIKNNDRTQYGVSEYVVDTENELQEIPLKDLKPGSTCMVIETSTVFMLNNKKEWKAL